MGWRKKISREVTSSLPAIGLGSSNEKTASKLKLPKAATLPQSDKTSDTAALTSVGRTVYAANSIASKIYAVPRLLTHASMVAIVGAVVLTGSTGHSAGLNPLANQVGFGSVLDEAAAVEVAAKVAQQTNLLVESEVGSTAKTLNSQVGLATSDDATLAKRQVVDTAGATARGITNYKVKPGDTLAGIASQFNVTTDTIRWANNVNSDGDLTPNRDLVILPISGVRYTVQPGDNPQTIAEKFQSNPEQIIAFNNAEISGIQAGQSIVVPDGVIPGTVARAESPQPSESASAAPVKVSSAAIGPNSYAYGFCTYYVAGRRPIPSTWGNARTWYSNAQISGYSVGSAPRVGAIAWIPTGYYGHVAYVEKVSGNNVTVSEMNWNGNWNKVTSRTVPASTFRYIY